MPKVLITRARADAGPLAEALRAHGLDPVVVPLIERAVDLAALADLVGGSFDGMVLTSAAAVRALSRLPSRPVVAQVAVVGPSTARAAEEAGWVVDSVASPHTAEALCAALGPLHGQRWLYPRAASVRYDVEGALVAAGATVVAPVAYRNEAPAGWREALGTALPTVAAVTLLSGSAALRYAEVAGSKGPPIVSIGPSTTAVAEGAGLTVVATAPEHTAEGVADATARWLASRSDG